MVFGNSKFPEILRLRRFSFPVMVLCITLAISAQVIADEGDGKVKHFKMISNVEYSGKGQFRNQEEMIFTVSESPLSDQQVLYSLSAKSVDLAGKSLGAGRLSVPKEFSFIIDKRTRGLSTDESDVAFLAKINNACVDSLKKITRENIGQTWQQSFNLSGVDKVLPGELKMTLKAIQLKSDLLGELIAVKAVSEPFNFSIIESDGDKGSVRCSTGAVYLFDTEIEEIYMSISIFNAVTKINGFKENLRNEVATYKTDAKGNPVDLSGLGRDFGKFTKDLGLKEKGLEVKEKTVLPYWAQSQGLYVAQVANVCTATACEGAANPVATVFMPTSQVVKRQGLGSPKTVDAMSVSKVLARDVPGVASMKIAVAPTFMGIGLVEGAAIAGGTVAIAAGSSSSSSSSRSPSQ